MQEKKVSVLIPVFNNLTYTKKCLERLIHLQGDTGLINGYKFLNILVDDGSTDGTYNWVKTNYPSVFILQGDGNLWWSGGINMGVTFAINDLNSDFILWWNNDVKPKSDYFDQLTLLLSRHTHKHILGSKIYFHNKDLIWGMGGRFNPRTGDHFMYGWGKKDSSEFQEPIEADWFPGMGTCFHRSVFEIIGFLNNKEFPQYHGDSDYTFRAKKAGYLLYAYPELILYNDNTNTGLIHKGSIKNLCNSLFSIKSNYNIKKNVLFYRKYSTSIFAYIVLFRKYFSYIGGFIKWKFFGLFGINKKEN